MSNQRGFTIVEVLVAVMVLAVGVIALVGSSATITRMIGRGRHDTRAALVAESFHEKEALALIAALREARAASAGAAGLASIEAIDAGADGLPATSWSFTAENLPIVKAIETELEKL